MVLVLFLFLSQRAVSVFHYGPAAKLLGHTLATDCPLESPPWILSHLQSVRTAALLSPP